MEQLQNLWSLIGQHIIPIAFILSLIIQIVPIKINPWTRIFKWIGKLITEDTDKNIKQLIKKTTELESTIASVQNDFKTETTAIRKGIDEFK